MKIIIIAAIGQNRELGMDNHLIWHLPKDLKFFKEKTMGKTILLMNDKINSAEREVILFTPFLNYYQEENMLY